MKSEQLENIRLLESEMKKCVNKFKEQCIKISGEISDEDQVDMLTILFTMVYQSVTITQMKEHLYDTYVMNHSLQE